MSTALKVAPFLAIFAVVGVAFAQGVSQQKGTAAPLTPPVAQLGPAFTGDNIQSLVETIKTDSLPKSEFETTVAYEARRNATRKDGTPLVFVFDEKQQFTYDADSEMMMTSIAVKKQTFYLERNHPEYSVLDIRRTQRSQREYIGSNAYGAQAKISSSLWDEYGIVINQSLEPTLLLAMNTASARDLKPFLRLGVACTLLTSTILENVSGHEATISSPFEFYTHYFYLPVVVSEMFIFDRRDGTALLRVHSNSSNDLAKQQEFRTKTFPIELEVKGSGVLFVSVDGGSEEPMFQNTIVRAKHRLNLKLQSQYAQPDLRLNGIAYRPAWSIHNKLINSISIFDYAEAAISSADVNRQSQSGTSQSPTEAHKIGETFQEWLAINQIDLDALCRENKSACKRLTAIQRTGHGEFWSTDNSHQAFGWIFKGGKVVEAKH
jgi:hypothetical protein